MATQDTTQVNTPAYGTQAANAPQGQVNVFDPNTGAPLAGAGAYNPNNGKAITSNDLAPNTPLKLPDSNSPTYSSGAIDGSVASNTTQSNAYKLQQDTQNKYNADKSTNDSLLQQLYGTGGVNDQLGNVNASVDRTAEDKARQTADQYTNQIEAEQLANTRQQEALDKNSQGLFGGALQDEKNRLNNVSLSKQADLAILQNAANRNYTALDAVANEQVQNNLASLTAKADNLKAFIDDNKANMTTEDNRLYQQQYDKVQADLKQQTDAENSIKDIKLAAAQYNAPLSVLNALSAIDTTKPDAYDKAITAAKGYLTDPLERQLKIAQINSTNRANGGSDGGNALVSSVVLTAPTPQGNKAVNGYTLQPGDDPYNIAQANGVDMDTLKSLNPNIKDWTTLQPGQTINLPDTSNAWLNGKSDKQIQAYNAIPDANKDSVQQLVTGSALMSDLVKSRGIQGTKAIQDLINQAKSVDPNFSVNENKLRYNYQQQFNNPNGKQQSSINAINTGLGHLAEFQTDAQALGNTNFTDVNALKNYIAKHTGDVAVTNFQTVVSALGSELATIYKNGTAPSQTEIENWENTLLANYSKDQFSGISSTTANLISNKLQSLNNTYKNVIGSYPSNPIINPDVIQQLTDAGVDVSSITSKLKEQGYSVPDNSVDPQTSSKLDTIWNTAKSSSPTDLLTNYLNR